MPTPRGALRLFDLLARLLPASFRQEFGDEMRAAVEARWTDLRGRGRRAGLRFWIRQWSAVARVALTLRLQRDRRRTRNGEGTMTGGLHHDVKLALRGLLRRPGFVLLTLGTLGLGIGASTAVFSAVHAVLLRSLPYADAERAVVVIQRDAETGERGNGLSASNARDLTQRSDALETAAVAEPWGADLEVEGRVESLRAWRVSEGWFDAVSTTPVHGRLFTPEEYRPDGPAVVVLGERSWRARFGADPGIIGRTVVLDGEGATVVGVIPGDFKFPDEAEFWTPRPPQGFDDQQRTADYMTGIARLAPGVGLEAARAEIERVARALARDYPESNTGRSFDLVPLREYLFGDVRTPLMVVLAAVALVLMIACANVAGLMIARGLHRSREFAVRRALGATTGRITRQLTVESALLAVGGGVVGLGLAGLGVDAIRALGAGHLPRIEELRIDATVLGFAVAVSIASALVAGVVPSLGLSRTAPARALGDGARGSTAGRGIGRSGRRLVVAEIALATVLVVGAGLLVRSLSTVLERDLGFASEGRLAVQVFAYDVEGGTPVFIREMTEGFEALPGVRSVAVTSSIPGATDGTLAAIDIDLGFTVLDRPAPPVGQEPTAAITQVSPGFFSTMGMPVLEGRDFEPFDAADTRPVVVVNETLARRHFGDASPIGRSLVIGYQPIEREIVGVVADVRPSGHESDPRPEVYFPIAQFPTSSLTFVLHGEGAAEGLIAPAREAVWEVRPSLAIWGVATVDELLGTWLQERRFHLMLLGSFAVVALLLATVGTYSLVSLGVERRVAELGIRRALGGGDARILRMIVGETARLAAVGVALGAFGAFVTTRYLRSMLFGVEPTDPATFVSVAGVVLLAASLGAVIPALRAIRTDPNRAIRRS